MLATLALGSRQRMILINLLLWETFYRPHFQSKSVVVRQVRELIMMDNQFGVSSPGLDILSYSDSVTYVNILCNR